MKIIITLLAVAALLSACATHKTVTVTKHYKHGKLISTTTTTKYK